jgi:hypothetical protein
MMLRNLVLNIVALFTSFFPLETLLVILFYN